MAKQKSKGGIFAVIALILVAILALGMIAQGRDKDSGKDSLKGSDTETSSPIDSGEEGSSGSEDGIVDETETETNPETFESLSPNESTRFYAKDCLVSGGVVKTNANGTTYVESNGDDMVFTVYMDLDPWTGYIDIGVAYFSKSDFVVKNGFSTYVECNAAEDWAYAYKGDNFDEESEDYIPSHPITLTIPASTGVKIAFFDVSGFHPY